MLGEVVTRACFVKTWRGGVGREGVGKEPCRCLRDVHSGRGTSKYKDPEASQVWGRAWRSLWLAWMMGVGRGERWREEARPHIERPLDLALDAKEAWGFRAEQGSLCSLLRRDVRSNIKEWSEAEYLASVLIPILLLLHLQKCQGLVPIK